MKASNIPRADQIDYNKIFNNKIFNTRWQVKVNEIIMNKKKNSILQIDDHDEKKNEEIRINKIIHEFKSNMETANKEKLKIYCMQNDNDKINKTIHELKSNRKKNIEFEPETYNASYSLQYEEFKYGSFVNYSSLFGVDENDFDYRNVCDLDQIIQIRSFQDDNNHNYDEFSEIVELEQKKSYDIEAFKKTREEDFIKDTETYDAMFFDFSDEKIEVIST